MRCELEAVAVANPGAFYINNVRALAPWHHPELVWNTSCELLPNYVTACFEDPLIDFQLRFHQGTFIDESLTQQWLFRAVSWTLL